MEVQLGDFLIAFHNQLCWNGIGTVNLAQKHNMYTPKYKSPLEVARIRKLVQTQIQIYKLHVIHQAINYKRVKFVSFLRNQSMKLHKLIFQQGCILTDTVMH